MYIYIYTINPQPENLFQLAEVDFPAPRIPRARKTTGDRWALGGRSAELGKAEKHVGYGDGIVFHRNLWWLNGNLWWFGS